jgi:hypothetical protein
VKFSTNQTRHYIEAVMCERLLISVDFYQHDYGEM